MLKGVQITGYKSLGCVKLKLPRLGVFLGASGSGKTAILEAFQLAAEVVSGEAAENMSIGWPAHLFTGAPSRQEAPSLVVDGLEGRSVTVADESRPDMWRLRFPAQPQTIRTMPYKMRPNGSCVAPIYRMIPERLKESSIMTSASDWMGPDGARLASALNTLLGRSRKRFQRVESNLQKVAPFIEQLVLGPSRVPGVEGVMGQGLWFHTRAARRVPAAQMSDGILSALGIFTLLELESLHLLLLEEPDAGLHPQAIGEVLSAIHDALNRSPKLQVLMTGHSPYLLDHLKPSEVFLTRLDENGVTQVDLMEETKDLDAWTTQFSPLEVWTAPSADEWVTRARRGV